MPQIRCPNCGTSINLEMRKKTDLNLIVQSLQKGPKTFTQLLKITRLPRKTLSLRLKELINSKIIIKDGDYRLNGSLSPGTLGGIKLKKVFPNSRKNTMLMLLMLCIGFLLAQAYAKYMVAPSIEPTEPTKPIIIETFDIDIVVDNISDLYAWQLKIVFDPEVMIVTNIVEGPFLEDGEANTLFLAATKIVEDIFSNDTLNTHNPFMIIMNDETCLNRVVLGGTLIGEASGVSGRGVLATITFGVIEEGSRDLQITDALALGEYGTELQGYTLTLEQG